MSAAHEHLRDVQRDHFAAADASHFAWQTSAPYFAATEAALLSGLAAATGARLLEVGCGEGANLYHLRHLGARRFGVDFSPARARFAARAATAHTATADAAHLPFAPHSFDVVLIRDLLHHLPDGRAALAEARRVLKPGGRLVLIEPNGRSPLVLLQALLVPAERGVLASTLGALERLVAAAGLRVERSERRQPLPLSRLLLHPEHGAPQLGRFALVRALLGLLERAAALPMPRPLWLYLRVDAVRP